MTGLKDIRYWLIAIVAVTVGDIDVVLQGGKNHADARFVVVVQLMLLLLELIIYLLAAVGFMLLRLCQQDYA